MQLLKLREDSTYDDILVTVIFVILYSKCFVYV